MFTTRSRVIARTIGRSQLARPSILKIAGRPNSSNATIELTGFPGSPRCGTRRPSGASNAPKASGFPGFIRTVQKSIAPSRASTSLTTSKSPRETPALVTIMSASSPERIFPVRSSTVSRAMPSRRGRPPKARTSAATLCAFAS